MRWLRALRWACMIATLLTMMLWASSLFWCVKWIRISSTGMVGIQTGDGALFLTSAPWPAGITPPAASSVLRVEAMPAGLRWQHCWKPVWERFTGAIISSFPLWIPLSVPMAGALVLWWREKAVSRRSTMTCVSCGYSRVGLAADAKCPECGTLPARG